MHTMYHCTTTRPALQARISADANVNIPNVLSLTQHHRSRSLAGVVLGPVGLRGGATPKTRALPEDKEQGSRGSEAEQMMKSSRKTLSSLDSLLGIPEEEAADKKAGGQPEQPAVPWWAVPPKQAAPPRQTAMAPGNSGRFMANESWMSSSQVRVGAKTNVGDALSLPQVQPIFSYGLFTATAIICAAAAQVGLAAGPDAAAEMLHRLALARLHVGVDAALAGVEGQASGDGSLLGLIGGLLAPEGPGAAAVALYGLMTLAPAAEAIMGYGTFLALYLVSGVAGEVVLLATTPPALEPTPCLASLPALAGLLGAMAAHTLRNRHVEKRASTQTTASGNKSLHGPGRPSGLKLAAHGLVLFGGCAAAAAAWSESHSGSIGLTAALTAGFAAGAGLGAAMGPKYDVSVELDLPEGAMAIPEDVPEMVVVIDQTTGVQRIAAAAGSAVAVAVAAAVVTTLAWQ